MKRTSSAAILRRTGILMTSVLAVLLAVVGISTSTAIGVDALELGTGLPLAPRTDTPRFIGGTVTDQTVVGDHVFVVGTFEQVRDTNGALLNQSYFAAYDIDTGALDRSYAPVFDREVQAIEPDGAGGIIVGGAFNNIDGVGQRKLVRLDSNGDRVASFNAEATAKVTAIAVRNGRVYVGGPFSSVKSKGQTFERHTIAAFVLNDGSLDTSFDFPIREAAGRGGELSVKSLAFAGNRLVVAHNGLTVDGQSRVGAALIQTTPLSAPYLLDWRTDFFKTGTTDAGQELAITDMAVSPDGSYFVIVSSGGDSPLQGRDSAVRFAVAGDSDVQPTWISRHFDSMFGVGISDNAVFVGGHFQYQEAPGSPDPYPGDPNVNYGAGVAGEGAAQLGNQVVARQQIGALDPTTGKSLNWNPGAAAEIGVESLVVVDRGLLVGQDGDTLGGKDIGRHGFFDITRDVAPTLGLTTSITSHFNGESLDAGSHVLAGGATDGDAGVKRVQLAIRELTSGQYLQANGSLGGWVGLDASLDVDGAAETNWTRTLEISQPGTYRVQAKTFALDGRKDSTPPLVDLVVRAAGDERPSVSVSSSSLDGNVATLLGSATDDRGVRSVTYNVQDQETEEFLQADGSMGPQTHRFDAVLAAIDAPETSWSSQFTLPRDGRYRVSTEVVDTNGQDDGKFQYNTITVAENDEAPIITLQETGTIEVESRLTITPEISDDHGLDNVIVRIRKQLTLEGTRPDNSFGANGTWVTVDINEGSTFETPTYQSPELPPGIYQFLIRATDTFGLTHQLTLTLDVGPINDPAPSASVDTRTVYESPQILSVTGTASDNSSIADVEVFVRNRTLNRWIAADGTLSGTPTPHSATLDNPGAASSDWSFSFAVDTEARYQVTAIAVDNQQQRSASTNAAVANLWYTPSDTLPEVGLISPVDGDTINGDKIFLTGRAEDDISVDRVRVRVRRNADNLWLRTDGTFGSAQFHSATLSNPDRPGTNWNFSTPNLDAGEYRVQIIVRDDSLRDVWETIIVTVAG